MQQKKNQTELRRTKRNSHIIIWSSNLLSDVKCETQTDRQTEKATLDATYIPGSRYTIVSRMTFEECKYTSIHNIFSCNNNYSRTMRWHRAKIRNDTSFD